MVQDYSQNHVDTLHMKNLLHLGEDRYLTMLLLQHFLFHETQFVHDAHAFTVAPETPRKVCIFLADLYYCSQFLLAPALLLHVPSILELIHQCLADEERSDSFVELSIGLIGSLKLILSHLNVYHYLHFAKSF
jgi:hypothetical protein